MPFLLTWVGTKTSETVSTRRDPPHLLGHTAFGRHNLKSSHLSDLLGKATTAQYTFTRSTILICLSGMSRH
jgi:hypothetical protein